MNSLALIEKLLKAARAAGTYDALVADLTEIGLKLGLTATEIEDALADDTMLTIYAP